jgi:macrolide-specific efflux system membrane fusion protein
VLAADGKTTPRQVRIGLQDGARAQVLEGLKAGEKVLLAPPPASAASAASAASS